jgi:Hemerythrin HHE cation binding domain
MVGLEQYSCPSTQLEFSSCAAVATCLPVLSLRETGSFDRPWGRKACAFSQSFRLDQRSQVSPPRSGVIARNLAGDGGWHESWNDAGMASNQMPQSIGERLLADHQHLDTLFSQLLADMHAGEWRICQRTWSRFERELLDHMAAEEALVLPSFERVNPSETVGLREDHATIRSLLADLGVRLELHAVKEEHVRHLIESLRSHAAREDALLYRWAAELEPDLQKALRGRLASHAASPQELVQPGAR